MDTQTLTGINLVEGVSVTIITHDEKFSTPNPGMTDHGKKHVSSLKKHVDHSSQQHVICGTGERHLDVAKALGLEVTTFTPSVGGPDSLEVIDDKKYVILSNGSKIPYAQYSLFGQDEAAKTIVNSLTKRTIICCGRPFLINLGVEGGKSGAVYKITGNQIEIIADGKSVGAGKAEV